MEYPSIERNEYKILLGNLNVRDHTSYPSTESKKCIKNKNKTKCCSGNLDVRDNMEYPSTKSIILKVILK
jgi:hypothetical protein